MPSHITFADGNSIEYEYAADGRKVRTTHIMNTDTTTTVYCGNAVYENGVLKLLLNEAGYYSFVDNKFHFYLKDHQGNVRVVADETGSIEEVNDYYPFGSLMSDAGNNTQPYKYNGKELDRKNGLNWYDYGARHYDPVLGRWHVVDPMAEKYYSLSPYNYCLNNPVLFIDSKGLWPTWGGLRGVLDTGFSFVNGAVRAVADNLLLGGTNLRETGIYSSASAYNVGQDVGDVISIVIGGVEVMRGLGEVTGGVAVSPETAGASLTVSAKGLIDVTHGSLSAQAEL